MKQIVIATLAVLAWFGSPAAIPVTVSGRVTDPPGSGIANVDLDFEDRDTGIQYSPLGDTTNIGGNYSVLVEPADYRIFFNPPPGSSFIPGDVDVLVSGNTTVDVVLAPGSRLTGYVVDALGSPLAGVDLEFFLAGTGTEVEYGGDNTDAAGFFDVLVDQNTTFDVLFRPSPGDRHAARQVDGVAVGTSDLTLPNLVLPEGFFVSGQVQDLATQNAVGGVDMDVWNETTGEKISRLGFDNTNGSGDYQIVLLPGTWTVIGDPSPSTGLAAEVRTGVVVTNGDVNVAPPILLPAALNLDGSVTNESMTPVEGVDLDAFDVSRNVEIPTSGDRTNASGQFSVFLGARTYDLRFVPPDGYPAAVAVIRNYALSGDATLPVVLPAGFVVSGTVRTGSGAAVYGANIDAVELPGGFLYPTLDDDSGAGGTYAVRIPGGSYRFICRPPGGSGLGADTVNAVVSTDRTIDFVLPAESTGFDEAGTPRALGSWLLSPAPNPARGPVTIGFGHPAGESRHVRIDIVSPAGRRVLELFDGALPGGEHFVRWDGTDAAGHPVPGGVYFVHLVSGDDEAVQKFLLVR